MTRAAGPTKTTLPSGQVIEDWTDHSNSPVIVTTASGGPTGPPNPIESQVRVGPRRDVPPGGTLND